MPSGAASTRSGFTLTGRSIALDPLTNAVRRDIADIRLADRVFAPHYVVPLPRAVVLACPLRDETGETLRELPVGDIFEVMELAGERAWGRSVGSGAVGFVLAAALADEEAAA